MSTLTAEQATERIVTLERSIDNALLMLGRLGGMLPGSKEVLDMVLDDLRRARQAEPVNA